ncbi:MAG: pilus assembly protein PilZ [Geobacteraceae bacterium GWC2_58_44]|nr:MAG: pilus assembly protein PilZ [Geobacteraceae bacterium GWC2_58_44]
MGDPELKIVAAEGEAGALGLGRSVSKSHLVNRLNYLNFQDQTILVNLRHLTYDNAIFLRARPLPCAGERLECVWAEIPSLKQLLNTYRFDYLLIPEGKKYLLVNSEVVSMNEEGLSLILPGNCREFHARRIKRHPVEDVSVQLIQHGALIHGNLVDFTPVSLRATGESETPATFRWINPEAPLNLRLLKGEFIVYSGAFEIISQSAAEKTRSFVLRQVDANIHRFKNKKYRNVRQQLVPSPNIVFEHPLIGKRINLKLADLSGTGFSVEESEGESVLMPGMIMTDLKITFAQGFSIGCTAQVVSRNVTGRAGEENTVRCGVALLDMDIREHVKLLSMLHQVVDRKSYVGTDVDMDDLWDFFFDTGFIYPGKYAHFQANKEEIKKTYAKLYGESPQIARHFIYLDRGAILGHMAMVRFYRDSWLIHHHAARKTVTIKAGLAVLDQVSHYLNELESFHFAHLRFVYCYYRPDNKFPSRVFGGFARQQHDPRICSQDLFAYWHYRESGAGDRDMPQPWELIPSSAFDLSELGSFYRFASGGLLIDAFDLQPGRDEQDDLAKEYRALGFKKEKRYYSLRKEGGLKAFILVNCTDAGFNMADLTNCVTMVILDENVPRELLERSLERVCLQYDGHEMPVLTYPVSYLEKESMAYDKTYLLWILNLRYSDDYFEYCEGLFRSVKKAS